MSDKNTYSRRRQVLQALGGIAGTQLIGTAQADQSTNIQFAEVGIKHQFEGLPDGTKRAMVNEPIAHRVVPEDDNLVILSDLISEQTLPKFKNEERLIWSNGYHSLPVSVLRNETQPMVVDQLNGNLQPLTAVRAVNDYKPPKVDVTTAGESIVVESRGREKSVNSGEEKIIKLQPRKVVIDTHEGPGKTPVKTIPTVTVRNYGDISVIA